MSHPAIAILRTLMHVPLLHLPFTTHRYSPTPFSRTTPLDAIFLEFSQHRGGQLLPGGPERGCVCLRDMDAELRRCDERLP
eukprot:1157409-Pelagomonas_calceolata.AAC.12